MNKRNIFFTVLLLGVASSLTAKKPYNVNIDNRTGKLIDVWAGKRGVKSRRIPAHARVENALSFKDIWFNQSYINWQVVGENVYYQIKSSPLTGGVIGGRSHGTPWEVRIKDNGKCDIRNRVKGPFFATFAGKWNWSETASRIGR